MKNHITYKEVIDALMHPSKIYSPYIPLLITNYKTNTMMTLNEIKKGLLKENPKATLTHIRKKMAYYLTMLNDETIYFEVPVDDMGDADFHSHMDSKLMLRWIVNKEN
jgi:hypothetical protein